MSRAGDWIGKNRASWVRDLSTYAFRVFVCLVGILSLSLASTRWKVGDGMSGSKGWMSLGVEFEGGCADCALNLSLAPTRAEP